jgi:hypothetical protein
MEASVEFYEKDPSNRGYGIQGYSSKDDYLNHLYLRLPETMKRMNYAYDYPKSYIPSPADLPFEVVQQNCPLTIAKFLAIPR